MRITTTFTVCFISLRFAIDMNRYCYYLFDREVMMESTLQSYIADRNAFHSFYSYAFYADLLMQMASLTLLVLMVKVCVVRWSVQ